MDPVKRQLIVKEIEYWRTNKLLPEQYCDFLRNLYLDHDNAEPGRRILGLRRASLLVAGTTSFILLFFLVFYFNSFPPMMQTMSALIVAGVLHGLAMAAGKRPIRAYALHGIASLLLLLSGIVILKGNGYDEPGWGVGLIAICGGIWVAVGWLARIPLLQLCGWICLLMADLWLTPLLYGHSPGWTILQLHTVPVAALLAFVRRLLPNGRIGEGAVLLAASALFWLSAEIYGIAFTDISGILLHPVLALKIMLLAIAVWAMWTKSGTPDRVNDHDRTAM